MGFEPPVLDQHTARAPAPVESQFTRREEEHRRQLLRTVVALLCAMCGGLAAIFLFFAAMGAVDVGDAVAATVIAVVLGVIWFVGFYVRHRSGEASLAERRDRERRGF